MKPRYEELPDGTMRLADLSKDDIDFADSEADRLIDERNENE